MNKWPTFQTLFKALDINQLEWFRWFGSFSHFNEIDSLYGIIFASFFYYIGI